MFGSWHIYIYHTWEKLLSDWPPQMPFWHVVGFHLIVGQVFGQFLPRASGLSRFAFKRRAILPLVEHESNKTPLCTTQTPANTGVHQHQQCARFGLTGRPQNWELQPT